MLWTVPIDDILWEDDGER